MMESEFYLKIADWYNCGTDALYWSVELEKTDSVSM